MTETKRGGERNSPTGTKAARTRKRIMDATARVVGQRGFAGTRLPAIAKEAGLQAAAIYYHFESREDLIEAVIREGTTQVTAHVREALAALPADVDPMDRIMTAVDAHLRVTLGMSDYTIAAVRNSRQLPDSMRESIAVAEEQYGILWRDLLEAAADGGRVRTDADLYLSRMLVLGALNWAVEWWRPEAVPVDTVIETAQTIVRHGIERSSRRSDARPLFLEPQP